MTPPKATASTSHTTDHAIDSLSVTSRLPRPKTTRSIASMTMTTPPRIAQALNGTEKSASANGTTGSCMDLLLIGVNGEGFSRACATGDTGP